MLLSWPAAAEIGAKWIIVAGVWLLASIAGRAVKLHPQTVEVAYWKHGAVAARQAIYDKTFTVVSLVSAILALNKVLSVVQPVSSALPPGPPWPATHHTMLLVCLNLASAVNGLAWLLLCARSHRVHRSTVMFISCVLRMAAVVLAVLEVPFGQPGMAEILAGHEMASLSHQPLTLILLRVMYMYTGVHHTLILSMLCPVPAHLNAPLYTLSAISIIFVNVPCAARLVHLYPHGRQALLGICQATFEGLDLVVAWPPADNCSVAIVQYILSTLGVIAGCVLPVVLIARAEYNSKVEFLKAGGFLRSDNDWQEAEQVRIGTPAAWRQAAWALGVLRVLGVVGVIVMQRLAVWVFGLETNFTF